MHVIRPGVGPLRRAYQWLRSEFGQDAAPQAYPGVMLLNKLIDLPSRYASAQFGGPEAGVYFLDYNYLERERSVDCLDALARARRAHGLDFRSKTLILCAGGLDPHGGRLLDLARGFARHHVFIELWNSVGELAELRDGRIEDLYLFPVSAALRQPRWSDPALSARPDHRVFVSLGGDDDLELLREVVRRMPRLRFYVPSVAWTKDGAKRRVEVAIAGPNVTSVRGSLHAYSPSYRAAFALASTVLLATTPRKRNQMRGGIRVADALAGRKRLVMAENPMCELLMAQPGKTCLVAPHDADALCAALERATRGELRVDRGLFQDIAALTTTGAKLEWMTRAAREPEVARRSVFFRDPVTDPDIARYAVVSGQALGALFDINVGEALRAPDGVEHRIHEIRRVDDSTYGIVVHQPARPPLRVGLATAPVSAYYLKTRRGHWLWHEGTELSPGEARMLSVLAERL